MATRVSSRVVNPPPISGAGSRRIYSMFIQLDSFVISCALVLSHSDAGQRGFQVASERRLSAGPSALHFAPPLPRSEQRVARNFVAKLHRAAIADEGTDRTG